jgi:hypothetical protein
VYARYACAPPLLGSEAPSSANELAPLHDRSAAIVHTARLALTLCVYATITPGDELRASVPMTKQKEGDTKSKSKDKRDISGRISILTRFLSLSLIGRSVFGGQIFMTWLLIDHEDG